MKTREHQMDATPAAIHKRETRVRRLDDPAERYPYGRLRGCVDISDGELL